MRDCYWVRVHARVWHAWPKGGRRSLCGRLNVEHLREASAAALQLQSSRPSMDQQLCATCGKKSGATIAAPTAPNEIAAAWRLHLGLYLQRAHVRTSSAVVALLADRLAEIGPPTDAEAQAIFNQVRCLLLRPLTQRRARRDGRATTTRTLPHVKAALEAIPARHGALRDIATTVRTWHEITQRPIEVESFHPVRVVTTMVQVPAPAPYIRHLVSRGLVALAVVFHPNTLERARKDPALRGLFAGSVDYWNRTSDQLRIVRD